MRPVPSIRLDLHSIELRHETVDDLRSLLQPAALVNARQHLEQMKLSFPDDVESREVAQRIVDAGGDVPLSNWSVTSREGIEYEYARYSMEDPDPAHLDGPRAISLTLRAGDSAWVPAEQEISLQLNNGFGSVTVTAPESDIRQLADSVRGIFDRYSAAVDDRAYVRPFTVFIAYGGGPAWEVVRNYLVGAGIEVDAFTESERVGEVTIDVVSQMIHNASMAVIVMTAAEQLRDGDRWFTRQNVVHEAGFAQGVLGVRNTIILLEEGVELPSNLANVTYIPFPRGGIHTTEARVVARVLETKADIEGGRMTYPAGRPY